MVTRIAAAKPWRKHKRVLIDTSVWIYHLEGHNEFGAAAGAVLAAMEHGDFEGIVSELTLMELLVRPLKLSRQDIADEYEILLTNFPNLVLAPLRRDVLTLAAGLRAQYGIKTPDAIVMATGIRNGATLAITNDAGWQRVLELPCQLLKIE